MEVKFPQFPWNNKIPIPVGFNKLHKNTIISEQPLRK